MEKVSAYKLAEILKVSHVTVYEYVKKGMPYTEKREGLRVMKRFDPEICQKWLEENAKT